MKVITDTDWDAMLAFREFYHDEVCDMSKHPCVHCDLMELINCACYRYSRVANVSVFDCVKIAAFMVEVFKEQIPEDST